MSATIAVATATTRDLARRPGVLLALLALAVFLQLIPDLCARAVDDSTALSLQAALTTIVIFLQLFAAFSGLRATSREGDLAAASEWRAAPLTASSYVIGRFTGVMAVAVLMFLLLVPLALLRQHHGLAEDPITLAAWASMAAGALLVAAQFAALGLLLASLCSAQLAAVVLLGAFAGTRVLVPAMAARGGFAATVAHLLPDPARLDLSRELAFHREAGAGAVAWGCGSAALLTIALLLVASWVLDRRET